MLLGGNVTRVAVRVLIAVAVWNRTVGRIEEVGSAPIVSNREISVDDPLPGDVTAVRITGMPNREVGPTIPVVIGGNGLIALHAPLLSNGLASRTENDMPVPIRRRPARDI